jgi:hypothetical protein
MWDSSLGEPRIWYHNTIANVIKSVFATFDNIVIARNYSDETFQHYKVPLYNAGKDIMIAKFQQTVRNEEENKLGMKERDIRAIFPAMGLSVEGFSLSIDDNRQTHQQLKYVLKDPEDSDVRQYMYNGVPVNMVFHLTIMANKAHEMFNIIENIFARFRPTINISILDTALNIKRDLRIALSQSNVSITKSFEFGKNRILEAELAMMTSFYVYPPIEDQGVIKHIFLNYKNMDNHNETWFIDQWDVIPEEAAKEDPHYEQLTQTDFPGTDDESSVIKMSIPVNNPTP